jgi:hypothetical protein
MFELRRASSILLASALAIAACSDDDPSEIRDASATDAATDLADAARADAAPMDAAPMDGARTDVSSIDGAPTDAAPTDAGSDGAMALPQVVLFGAPASMTQACGLAPAPSGDLFVVGQTNGPVWGQAAKGARDMFVARVRRDGSPAWVQQIGDRGIFATGCAVTAGDSGELYVAGMANGVGTFEGQALTGTFTGFAARFEANGTRPWLRVIGEAPGPTELMAVDHHAGVVRVLGWTKAPVGGMPSPGQGDVILARLDAATGGPSAATLRFGSEVEDVPLGLVRDATGLWLGFRRFQAPLTGALGHELLHLDAQDKIDRKLAAATEAGFAPVDFAVLDGHVLVLGQTFDGVLRGYDLREHLPDGSLGPTRMGSRGDGLQARAFACTQGMCAITGQVIGAPDGSSTPAGDAISGFVDLVGPDLRRIGRFVVEGTSLTIGAALAAAPDRSWYLAGWSTSPVLGRPITGNTDGFLIRF